MKILKRVRPVALVDDAAVADRLKAITSRGKVELSFYVITGEPPKPPARLRLFWTPHELAAETSGA